MEQKKLWKRLLSVILSVCMVVSLITISDPNRVEASDGTNILANGDFANANSAWVDQNDSSVPAQALVDDVKVTSERKYFNDFSGTSPTHGWNVNNTYSKVEDLAGNKVLSFVRGTNDYIRYYGTSFESGKTYVISCKVYCDTATTFRLYDDSTGTAVYVDESVKAGEWKECSITVTASNNVNQPLITFKILDKNTQQVYLDDVSIVAVTTKENMVDSYSNVHTNDFSSSSTWGWALENVGAIHTLDDGNKVLSWTGKTSSSNTYVRFYGTSYTAGETYVMSCKIKANGQTSVRLYFDDNAWVTKTVNSDAWTEFSVTITPTKDLTQPSAYFAIRDNSGNTVYLDDMSVKKYEGQVVAKTYSNGIGTCNNAETDNVLVMKDYTKVTQPVTITSGATYSYSFSVKEVKAGGDFAASVIAGNETVQTITATSEWTTVEGEFTATADAANFGFARTGEGELWIDDVVLIPSSTEPMPADHTSLEGPYIPDGHINLLSGAATDFSSSGHGHTVPAGATVQNGYLKTPIKSGYIQFGGMSTVAGQEYTFSCYIWTEGTGYKLQMYEAGVGSASGSNWEFLEYSCGKDTKGWVKVEYSFTAKGTGSVNIGFQETWGGEVTLYVDDVALTTAKPGPSDHTVQGGAYIPDGHINLLSGAATDFSSSGHGHTVPAGATVQNGYLKTPIKSGYIQFGGMSTVAGQEYTFSCYIWTEGTGYKLQMYEAGVGSASGSNWEFLEYSCGKDTKGWVKVEYSFTAKGTGSVNIGFQETWGGEVTLYVDDVALTTAKPGPSDHTVQGGAYIPDGHINLLSGAATDFSSSGHGHTVPAGATVQNGYLKTPIKSGYIQFGGMSTVAGQEYTFSCYIWTEGTGYKLQMYEAGVGSASGSNWEFLEYSCGKDTKGWVKVEYSFTAKGTGSVNIGFQETWGGEVTLYVDDVALTTEAAGVAEDIKLTYEHGASNFHYEQENRLYIKSTGTAREDLTGTLKINGTEVTMEYKHYDKGLVLLFNGKLSDTDVNTVVIPAGTTLYKGSIAFYNIANTFTIYTQKVADGQWMTWLSEYDYQGSDVLYYDMGTAGTKYVFNNVTGITYQGVLKVTGKADIMLGGTTNSSEDVTALGDYEVSRTVKGEKYDYTVALYKRGDADKTQDGVLTAKDLVASKRAVSADSAEFGHARYKAADSNTDGVVNEEDAAFMRYILVNDEYDITTTTSKGYSTLGQGVMPIVGYGGPDDHVASNNQNLVHRSELGYEDDFLKAEEEGGIADQIFGLVKDLGINVFTNQVNEVGEDYVTSTKMLKLAQKYNLGVYINNAYISGAGTVETELVPQTAKYDMFSSFHGYYVADEPSNASAINNYTTQLTALKNRVNIASYFNMSPLGDSSFSGNANTYKTYLQAALNTGAESLQYDMYLRGKTNLLGSFEIKTAEFYENLDIARTLSMNASKPFQAFVQTGANWKDSSLDRVSDNNKLTVQEMYLEANAALAMGAKGINYFTLLESTKQVDNGDNYSGLITVSGEANHNEGGNYDYYNAAKKINTFIAAVDEVLMNATSKGIISDNSTVTSSVSCEVSNYGSVQSITGTEYMVGCFDYYGKDAYLIVNIMPDEGNGGTSQNITLNFDGTYSYTATNMACTKTTASGQSANFTVGAGEAVLVVVE